MNLSIIKKDFKRNKSINVVLLSFIVLSAFLMSVATMIIIQLFGSIDSMYEIAKPPHFMQMHVGEIDQNEIDEFASSIDYVEDQQTVEMVNIYSGNIWITKSDGTTYSMSDSLLDMGWVKQNVEFDRLLNMDNQPITPSKGEVGVPLILLDTYDIEIGDTLTIKDGDYSIDFVVSTYVRDPQMNSTLASSTRFLINDDDFEMLKENTGTIEYLIEFYLNDTSQASKFQTAYEKADMPANGQAITYGILRLISGLSDIMMALILVLVSFALIFVVFLCLRFTILTVMEEEIKSIGTMRAIGMTYRNIRQIYMMKYRMLTLLGCGIGYTLSILLNNLFTSHITETFGAPKMSVIALVLPILTVLIVYMLEVHFSKRVMKRIKKITVVDALVSGGDRDINKISKLAKLMSLNKLKKIPVNGFLAIRQVMIKTKTWFVMLFVVVIATTIMIIPMNLLNTFKSPQFITYMGQSESDIIISIPQSDNITERYNEVSSILNEDSDINYIGVEARVVVEAINKDDEWINIHVDSSEDANSDLQYLEGDAPTNKDEIAISVMNANELDVGVGDALTMKIEGEELDIVVSGIYQDVTSGGYTAKMIRPYNPESVEGYSFFIKVKDNVSIEEKVDQYQSTMGMDIDVTHMEAFINQTLGGVTAQLGTAVYTIAVLVVFLVSLITVLFIKLLSAKEYSQIAIMKALGFSVLDIRKQYLLKVSLVSFVGVLIGTLLTMLIGEVIVSSFLNLIGLGISKISFIVNPYITYLLFPLAMIIIVMLVTWTSSQNFKKYNIIQLINE